MKSDYLGFSIWAVGGGKGGTGKSVVSTLVSLALARMGRKVVLLDADLGGANLHSLFGMKLPQVTLHDFVEKKIDGLEEAALDTGTPGLRLVSGANDVLSLANPKYAQKTRMLNAIKRLNADVVLLDLGAGMHYNTLDFALLADTPLLVLTPQMTSLENAYGFLKGMLFRKLERSFKEEHPLYPFLAPALKPAPGEPAEHLVDCFERARDAGAEGMAEWEAVMDSFRPGLVVNQAATSGDTLAAGVMANVACKYLGVQPDCLGAMPIDPGLRRQIDSLKPLSALGENVPAVAAACDIAKALLAREEREAREAREAQERAEKEAFDNEQAA